MMAQHHSVLYTATPGAEIFPGVRDMASQTGERPITVYAAIASNLVIAVSKFVVAFITGSSSMLSEGIHSTVDTGNELLILLGVRQSRKKPDEKHPFGHGKELYFWSLIVALLLFSIGGGMSVYEGVTHIQHPVEITDLGWNYLVLGIAFIAESISWGVALKHTLKEKQEDEGLWHAIRNSKDPSVFTVLAEDTAALLGLAVAFIGITLGHFLHNPVIDGVASIVIGAILILVAIFLAGESKSLIVGESADEGLVNQIRKIAEADAAIKAVPKLLTMQFGPNEVLVNMEIQFKPDQSSSQIVTAIDRVEHTIRDKYPQAKQIFVEAECLKPAANGSHPTT
jgi:cation diffusion facilitator family transporter